MSGVPGEDVTVHLFELEVQPARGMELEPGIDDSVLRRAAHARLHRYLERVVGLPRAPRLHVDDAEVVLDGTRECAAAQRQPKDAPQGLFRLLVSASPELE